MKYVVIRKPCLQKDEGRHFYVNQFETREQAQEFIDAQEGEYFRPHDYYIAEVQ